MPDDPPAARAPVADGDSAPFWAAVAAGRLTAQCCAGCGRFVFYPRALCPYCHGQELAWHDVAGTGTIYSRTISRRPAGPVFAALVPYVVALIDLDEGFRMMSNVIGADALSARCGDRVRVVFSQVDTDLVLPLFELARTSDQELR